MVILLNIFKIPPSPSATGYADGSPCMQCSGTGWILLNAKFNKNAV